MIYSPHDGLKNLKAELPIANDRIDCLLIWCNICTICNYLLLMLSMLRIYGATDGHESALFIFIAIILYFLLAIYIYIIWKSLVHRSAPVNKVNKSQLIIRFSRLVMRRRVIQLYVLAYGICLVVCLITFFSDFNGGLSLRFKIIAVLSLPTYPLGLYFLVLLSKERNKLETIEGQVS